MFKLSISLDDDALFTHTLPTLVTILEDATRKVRAGVTSSPLRDPNGNTVGRFDLTK